MTNPCRVWSGFVLILMGLISLSGSSVTGRDAIPLPAPTPDPAPSTWTCDQINGNVACNCRQHPDAANVFCYDPQNQVNLVWCTDTKGNNCVTKQTHKCPGDFATTIKSNNKVDCSAGGETFGYLTCANVDVNSCK